MTNKQGIIHNSDKTVILLYLIMVTIGWLSIYAAEFTEGMGHVLNFSTSYGKQFVFILTSLVVAAAVMLIDVRFFTGFANIIYAVAILLLIAVLFAGVEINATRAWFRIGGLAFQPSEIAKYATALALASIISSIRSRKPGNKDLLKGLCLILLPAGLVLLQKDVGTTLVFLSFSLALFREGWIGLLVFVIGGIAVFLFVLTLMMNEFIIISVLAFIAFFVAVIMRKKSGAVLQVIALFLFLSGYVYSVDYAFDNILQPHHKARIEVLVHGNADLQGAGYNLHQSKIAIGSGGLWGKGFLQGTQTQFNFVPEQTTDFIFCTVGEEWGFAGSLVIIGLFVWLLLRLIYLAERQKSTFSRVFGYCITSVLLFHFAVNIGMTVGLVPVIGIPLPLLSYGGSSLWGTTLMLFTFLKFDANRHEMI
ncbi:MAG: rod shape-determining protein RodA [Bacteroidia bacterium]|nr:MAG: rod shape-determining protein RodA [Bacteroidia bacterium]